MNEVKVEQSVEGILLGLIAILLNDLKKRQEFMREGLFHGVVLHKTGVLEC